MRTTHVIAASILTIALAAPGAAQTPQPFPKPGTSKPATPPAGAESQPAKPPVVAPPAPSATTAPGANDTPTEVTLGVQIYPGARFLASYDAGKGQRYYLFGAN